METNPLLMLRMTSIIRAVQENTVQSNPFKNFSQGNCYLQTSQEHIVLNQQSVALRCQTAPNNPFKAQPLRGSP